MYLGGTQVSGFDHMPADRNYCRFQPVLLVDEITDVGNEMGVQASRIANVLS